MALLNEGHSSSAAGGAKGKREPGEPSRMSPIAELTDKQRQVLDLLIQHKTSKEISRALGISPHTVDQRIMLSRTKLGVSSRSEVAQAYRRLIDADGPRETAEFTPPSVPPVSSSAAPLAPSSDASPVYEQPVYGFSHVASPAFPLHQNVRDDLVSISLKLPFSEAALPKAALPREGAPAGYYHVLPEQFDGRYGTLLRLGAIALITAFLMLILMGGLAMFAQLAQILDR